MQTFKCTVAGRRPARPNADDIRGLEGERESESASVAEEDKGEKEEEEEEEEENPLWATLEGGLDIPSPRTKSNISEGPAGEVGWGGVISVRLCWPTGH